MAVGSLKSCSPEKQHLSEESALEGLGRTGNRLSGQRIREHKMELSLKEKWEPNLPQKFSGEKSTVTSAWFFLLC